MHAESSSQDHRVAIRENEAAAGFQVSGAGGVGAAVNGRYVQNGVHLDRPVYAQVGGEAVIYFSDCWKINGARGYDGWLYAVESATGALPPTGRWTTFGYDIGDADPAPIVKTEASGPSSGSPSGPSSGPKVQDLAGISGKIVGRRSIDAADVEAEDM